MFRKKTNSVLKHENFIPTMKHGGGEHHGFGLVCCLFPGRFSIIDKPINARLCQQILQEKVRVSVSEHVNL